LSNGPADYAVRLEGGKLASRVKDGTKPGTPVWRDPAKVTIQLTGASQTRAPGGAFAFLGPAGAPLWQIPQTQKDGVVWLGWNTEELSSSQLSTGVDWRLDRVTGPGNLAVFEFDSFGRPKIIFNSGDGVPDTYRIPLGTHAHGNWSFTKPGTYRATFTHTATLTTGATSTTTSTLTFAVGGTTTNAHNSAYTADGANAQSAVAFSADRTSAGVLVHELSKSRAEDAQVVHKVVGGAGLSAAGGCKLASTGGEVGVGWVAGGGALVVAGVVALVATRHRRGDA
jgi:putative ABC transporter-associated repeat protein